MRIAIMQPYLFPYIGYFQLLHAVDKFVLLDDVNYINKGWINRNRMLVNGEASYFTVPLEKASQNRLIKDISIANDPKWKEKLLKKIEFSYKKAPFFDTVFPRVQTILNSHQATISGFVYESLVVLLDYLQISTPVVATSAVYNNSELKAQERIIDICVKENSTVYINPSGGTELYNREKFRRENLELQFLQPQLRPYKQFNAEFIPGLSIIDVLMFNGRQQVQDLLQDYQLT